MLPAVNKAKRFSLLNHTTKTIHHHYQHHHTLPIFFPKMSAYRRDFDEIKYISFLNKDDKLLEKYNEIWEKVKNRIKKKFDSEPVYKEKYLKAKIKFYNGRINKNVHNNKIPKEGSKFNCLSVTLINSVFKAGKNVYPKVLLEECKYVVKEKQDT